MLSEATAALVRDDLPDGARLLDLGEHRLKDLSRPERVHQLVAPGLPVDFPPLVSLDARRHNLPLQTTPLLGRDQAVGAVRGLLLRDEVRLVTLTGPGGTGKTRLGLQAAADLLDRFEDGAFFVELAPISDPALVPSTIARVLDVWDVVGRPLLDVLVDYLRGRQLLLVLDNFEQVLAAVTVVDALLRACPGLRVLATSRATLQLRAEHEYPVPPLALPEPGRSFTPEALSQYGAVALFVERATAVKPDFVLTNANAPAVAEICARLDGLPLAIELAAARIRLLSPEAMLPRLGHGLALLSGGRRDLPARQQTLRGAIAWSYDLLPETQQRLFRHLSMFVGGFTLEAAEAVCTGDPTGSSGHALGIDLLDEVGSLVDNSLIRPEEQLGGEPRFRMLETIREYGLEQLRTAGEETAVRRRHLGWFADLAERCQPGIFGPDGAEWLDRLASELDNFRAALAWGLTDPSGASARAGLRIAGALQQLWLFRDNLTEGQRWLEQTLAADQARGRADGRGDDGPGASDVGTGVSVPVARRGVFGAHPRVVALIARSVLLLQQGKHEQGAASAEDALALARGVRDRLGEAHALTNLGNVARASGEYQRAVALLEESLATFRSFDDPFGTWRSLQQLGTTLSQAGDGERAGRLYEESLAVAQSMGYSWGVAWGLLHLGGVAHRRGDLDRATVLLEESLAWWAKQRATRGRHASLCELGRVVLARGDPQRAAAYFTESLALCREAGDRPGIARCLEGLAAAATAGTAGESVARSIRAARLLGSAASVREALAAPVSPSDGPIIERAAAAARARLGEEAYASAWAKGRDMPLNRAIDAYVP